MIIIATLITFFLIIVALGICQAQINDVNMGEGDLKRYKILPKDYNRDLPPNQPVKVKITANVLSFKTDYNVDEVSRKFNKLYLYAMFLYI